MSTAHSRHTSILLKTAIATVSSQTISSDAAILFDEGSQRSFITEEFAQMLKLTPKSTETIQLAAFGGLNKQVQHVETATVYLQTDGEDKVPIRVLIVPKIAAPIENCVTSAVSQLPHLRGLKLAHPIHEHSHMNISLLIGADFYWDIVEDRVIRGNGPTAVKSKIGYLLS